MSTEQGYRCFDDFRPGDSLGSVELRLEPTLREGWRQIGSPSTDDRLPPGLLVALLMRGYGQIVDRRPPGNVHAGLRMNFLDDRLVDDSLRISVHCADAALRKGRRWVELDTEQWSGDHRLTQGRLTLLWAR